MFAKISNFTNIVYFSSKFLSSEFGAVQFPDWIPKGQTCSNCVDLGKCCDLSLNLQKSALIEPSTSTPKFAEIFKMSANQAQSREVLHVLAQESAGNPEGRVQLAGFKKVAEQSTRTALTSALHHRKSINA